jgi:hypothetical protein
MALTIATKGGVDLAKPSPQMSPIGVKVVFGTVQFDSSYAAGGEAIAAADFGLTELLGIVMLGTSDDAYVAHYDYAAGTLVANAVGAEATGDRSALIVKVAAFGI